MTSRDDFYYLFLTLIFSAGGLIAVISVIWLAAGLMPE